MTYRVNYQNNFCNLSIDADGELIKVKFKKELDNTILNMIKDSNNLNDEQRKEVIGIMADALYEFEKKSLLKKYKKSE